MWGQKYNDDWYQMCWTTPGQLPGISKDLGFPKDCQQRVRSSLSTFLSAVVYVLTGCQNEDGGGMIGVWEYHDGNCHLQW